MADLDLTPLMERMRDSLQQTEGELAQPNAYEDRERFEHLSREHQRLSRLIGTWDALTKARSELVDNQDMLDLEEDAEFLAMIKADIERLELEVARREREVLALVVPPGEHDSRNTIMEIRPAAGGDEAGLFAGDLFRMYSRYAENKGWKLEILSLSETELGGIKDVSFSLTGQDVYRHLQFESGVHRVQRIPSTETSGRIHTSTVTVAVLPEAQEVDIQINPADLSFDVFRASGAGGQHVNTTDSAVRVTHIPTGVVSESQQERSQHRNREIALRMLRAKLLEAKAQEEAQKYASARKSQVGTGDRSERIRTYNFARNQVADHRWGLSWFALTTMLNGDLDDMIEDILASVNTQRLEDTLSEV